MADDTNYLDMSDEDMLEEQLPTETLEEQEEVEDTVTNEDSEIEETTSDTTKEEDEKEEGIGDSPNNEETTIPIELEDTEDVASTEDTDTTEINYEEEYKKILAPLRANGKDLIIETIEDLRNLASMGANYTKKMTAIKPSLRVLKMLENNNLLDEAKINYLIDLDKKNPDAVKQLIKDSEVDPLDIDTDEESTYTPNTYNVSEQEIELDNIIKDIQSSPKFDETIDVISNKWDDSSKQVIVETPQLIKVINEHIESGIYEQITSVVERERMLGRLLGMSDIEAYKQVGDALQANNKLKVQNTNTIINPEPVKPTRNTDKDKKLKNRKRAASTTKTANNTVGLENDFDPLSMSDEEFENISSKYI